MGVDCRLTLPSRVRVRDVATVIGILLGCKVNKEKLGSDGWHVKVDGVEVTACGGTLPECVNINVAAPKGPRWFLYHYEFGADGSHGIMPRSTAENIAMCKAIADFFGGIVDYSDCDHGDGDYYVRERFDIHGEDDEAFYRKQERMVNLEPLTSKQIEDCEPFAAYKKAA